MRRAVKKEIVDGIEYEKEVYEGSERRQDI